MTPAPTGVRRIIGPSHTNRKARLVMFTGSAIQLGIAIWAAEVVGNIRGGAPLATAATPLLLAAIAYLPAAYLTAFGYTHLNPIRAALYLPLAAVVGVLALALIAITGGAAGAVSTRLEGETEAAPRPNLAAALITSDDAAMVLGSPAGPPGQTHGFGSRVSSCEVHAANGHGYVELKVLQGPGVPQLVERYQERGTRVADLGDEAYLGKRELVIRVADTMLELIVIGIKLNDARVAAAVIEVGRRVAARVREPATT